MQRHRFATSVGHQEASHCLLDSRLYCIDRSHFTSQDVDRGRRRRGSAGNRTEISGRPAAHQNGRRRPRRHDIPRHEHTQESFSSHPTKVEWTFLLLHSWNRCIYHVFGLPVESKTDFAYAWTKHRSMLGCLYGTKIRPATCADVIQTKSNNFVCIYKDVAYTRIRRPSRQALNTKVTNRTV